MQQSRRLRIAVSGYVGTGKSELCLTLAGKLRLPVIPENMTGIARAGVRFTHALRAFRADPRAEDPAPSRRALVETFLGWTADRAALYADPSGFVADRWEADLLAWWLISNLIDDDATTVALVEAMQTQVSLFDYIVFPHLTKPFVGKGTVNTDGLVRAGSFSQHIAYHTMLAGLMQELTRTRVIRLPQNVETAEERAEYVLNVIANDRVPAGGRQRRQ